MICTATDGSDASDRAQFDDIHPAYDTLTPHQKEVYNDLLGPISRAEWRIGCAVLDEYDNVGFLFDILNAIESDHPEYWW